MLEMASCPSIMHSSKLSLFFAVETEDQLEEDEASELKIKLSPSDSVDLDAMDITVSVIHLYHR
jgi:hypothetical protein